MASLARAGRLLSRAGAFATGGGRPSAPQISECLPSLPGSLSHVRGMASGHGKTVEYAGLKLHEPAKWHKNLGEGLAALMWFWIFVRAYHDGSTLLFGHAPHFEHELEHEAHGHGEHELEHEAHGHGEHEEEHH